MALELRVPAERVTPPKDLEIRPRQAKAWVEALPLSRCGEAGLQLLGNLGALNRSQVEYDDRLQILEAYRPVAAVILEELEAVYGKAALPLPPKAREAFVLARDLTTEFAYGYKILVLERPSGLLAFGARKQAPLLVHRALDALVQLMQVAYRSYTPIPAGTWREAHQLYLHAEAEGFAVEPTDAEGKFTIADRYIEALLASLADPYRQGPGELDLVGLAIHVCRSSVTLGQARPETQPGGHFLVPCDQDRPPKPLLAAHDDPGGPNWRILDANPIVDKLRARRQAMESGHVTATMSRAVSPDLLAMMGKLVTLWGDPPRRAARRDPMDTSVALCVGLRAITHFLSLEPSIDTSREAEAIERGITIPLISVPDDDTSRGLNVREWEVVNLGPGGIRVRRDGDAGSQPIAVGEVVGIKSVGKARWSVGAIRWITLLEEGGMEFGIQFLASSADCVAVQPTIAQAGTVRAGLLLANEDGAAAGAQLLTPTGTHSDLREFELEQHGRVSRVRAMELIERTQRFDLFHVAPS